MRAKVYVTPKEGVLDPAGKALERALHTLGFSDVAGVRLGRYIEFELDGPVDDARLHMEEMCRRLLANGVVEDYRFEVTD